MTKLHLMAAFLLGVLLLEPLSLRAQSISYSLGGLSSTPTKVSPGAVVWNPAVIGLCSGTQLESNLTLAGGWMIYDRDGIDPNTHNPYQSSDMSSIAPLPFVAVNSSLGTKDFRFGYATYFPGGVVAEFDPNGSQRYNLTKGMVIPWHHQFTVAYRPNSQWSIGVSGIYSVGFFASSAAFDLETFMAGITSSEDIPKEHPALTARATIPLTRTQAFGGGIGLLYTPTYQWSFGLSAFLPMVYVFEGQLNLETPPSIATLSAGLRALGLEETIESKIESTTALPPYIHAGVSYQPYGYFTMEFFGRYTLSSLHDSTALTVKASPIAAIEKYSRPGKPLNDTYMIGAVNSFSLWQHWTLGLNTTYGNNGVEDRFLSTSIVDFNTFLVGAFAQFQWSHDLKIGAEYSHSFMFDRSTKEATTETTDASSMFRSISTDGSYRAGLDRFGVSVKYVF